MSDEYSENPYAAPATAAVTVPESMSHIDYASLKTTATGLTLMYGGIVCLILAGMTGAVGGIVHAQLQILTALFALLGIVLNIIGPFFCLSAPEDTKAKLFVGLFLSIAFFAVSLIIFAAVLSWLGGDTSATRWMRFVSQIGFAASQISFIVFLMKLASYLQRPELALRAKVVLMLTFAMYTVSLLAAIVVLVSAPLGRVSTQFWLSMLGLLMLIMGLVVLVMYANLINALAKVIRSSGRANFSKHIV